MEAPDESARVLEANEAFYASFNRKDIAAMQDAWSMRHDITCIHPGWNVLRGHTQVIESWTAILGNPNQPRIVVGGAEVTMSGGTAIVICRELVAGSGLAATNVFVHEGGAWRLLHHQSGPVSNM